MTVYTNSNFSEYLELHRQKLEGLVFYGTGGSIADWANWITNILRQEGVVKQSFEVTKTVTVNTTDGRIDTLMLFNENTVDQRKLAEWCLAFEDCCWLSDYVVNYATQHGYADSEDDYDEKGR